MAQRPIKYPPKPCEGGCGKLINPRNRRCQKCARLAQAVAHSAAIGKKYGY